MILSQFLINIHLKLRFWLLITSKLHLHLSINSIVALVDKCVIDPASPILPILIENSRISIGLSLGH